VGGQNFGGYYFDDAAPGPDHRSSHSFQTWFAAYSPTKFYYAEDVRRPTFGCGEASYPQNIIEYEVRAITSLLRSNPKTFMVNVWDIDETPLCGGRSAITIENDCISPFTAEQCQESTIGFDENCSRVCGEELCIFPVSYLKGITTVLDDISGFRVGRTEMHPTNNDPVSSACGGNAFCNRDDYPTIIYNFDNSGSEFSHWRKMVRN